MDSRDTVTGQQVLLLLIAELSASGYLIVPRVPTQQMLEDAGDYAHDEDAAGVWRAMIASYEGKILPFRIEDYAHYVSSGNSFSGNG